MPLSRTWYTDANIVIPDGSTAALAAKSILFSLKALLKGTMGVNTQGLWTVVGSSDGLGNFSMAGADLWTDTFDGTKIVRGAPGVNHSWMLMQSPVALGPYYMLIDYSYTTDRQIVISYSKTAFTGGSATTAPTSTMSWLAVDGATSATLDSVRTFHDGLSGTYRVTRVTDADGNFWFLTARNGSGFFQWVHGLQTLAETRPGELHPTMSFSSYSTTIRGACGGNELGSSVDWGFSSHQNSNYSRPLGGRRHDGTAIGTPASNLTLSTVHFCHVSISSTWMENMTTPNPADGKHETMPVWVYHMEPGYKGIRGTIPDVSWISYSAPVGSSEPSSASQERMVVGAMLLPSSVAPTL